MISMMEISRRQMKMRRYELNVVMVTKSKAEMKNGWNMQYSKCKKTECVGDR